MRKLISLVAFSLTTLWTAPSLGGEIEGKIILEKSRRVGDVSVTNAVVFFRPELPVDEQYRPQLSAAPAPVTMRMEMKAFAPTVVSVDVGTEVSFPNADRVIHNAFSTTRRSEFDLGFYGQGETKSWVFDEPGLVKVFCNVHQGMVGHVMVMDTPYHTRPNDRGEFTLSNVQPGVGKLFIWHPRGKTYTQTVEIGADGTITELTPTLKLTKRLVPNHKNKFGKPYKRSRDY